MLPNPDRLELLLDAAARRRVAVVGDFMLDRHIEGSVRRISPEAPVPVVEIESERSGLGGAGNVVANLAALGIQPVAFGVVGADPARDLMLGHLRDCGCDCAGVLESAARKTTEKIRVIAEDQHVVRVDRESVAPLSQAETASLIAALTSAMPSLDAVILQDYNKGVLTAELIEAVLQAAARTRTPVAVDPKFDNFLLYRHAHLFKPNVREVERALGLRLDGEDSLLEVCRELTRKLQPEILMITRGDKGMAIYAQHELETIPTHARDVHDVSGAGDTVIATFVAAELGGAAPVEAAALANLAAGVVCEQVGVVPIHLEKLRAAVQAASLDVGATSSAG